MGTGSLDLLHLSTFLSGRTLPVDHRLLTTILKGQIITRHLKKNGNQEFLWKVFTVSRAKQDQVESTGSKFSNSLQGEARWGQHGGSSA